MYAFVLLILTLVLGSLGVGTVDASESNGTIESANASSRICKDATCTSYGRVNWKPTGSTAIAITDSGITGYAWGDEIGWINFDPTGSGVDINSNTGALSGYAYANTGSWINFNPTDVSGGTDVGVTIDSDGEFTGWAWVSGANGGWMKFDCGLSATCVKTDWRPVGSRTATSTTEEGGSGSGGKRRVSENELASSTPDTDVDQTKAAGENAPDTSENSEERGQSNGGIADSENQLNISPENSEGPKSEKVIAELIAEFYNLLGIPLPNFEEEDDLVLGFNSPTFVSSEQPGRLVWDFTPKDGEGRFGSGPLGIIIEILRGGIFGPLPGSVDGAKFAVTLSHEESAEIVDASRKVHRGAVFNITAVNDGGEVLDLFPKPLKITLIIPELVSEQKKFAVYYRSEGSAEWLPIPDVAFTNLTAIFSVGHLTSFAVFEITDSTPVESSTSPRAVNLYWPLALLVFGILIYGVRKYSR